MKKFHIFSFFIFSVMLLCSCGSVKNVAYLQNSDSINLDNSRFLYDARIMPKDQLTISVNTTTPEASVPFNLLLQNEYSQGRSVASYGGMLMPYLVDNEGFINFPIIGRLQVGGLTKSECEKLIAQAKELLTAVREHYLPSEAAIASITSNQSSRPESVKPKPVVQEPHKKKKDIEWSFLWVVFFVVLVILAAIFS